MSSPGAYEWIKDVALPWLGQVFVPVGTFILGFVVRTFIPTKRDQFDMASQRAKTSRELLADRQAAYTDFAQALIELDAARGAGHRKRIEQAYWKVRTSADRYFPIIDMIASYARRGDIDNQSAKQDHLDELVKVARKAMPKYYEVINAVAVELGLSQTDRLSESTYRNVRLLLESELSPEEFNAIMVAWGIRVQAQPPA